MRRSPLAAGLPEPILRAVSRPLWRSVALASVWLAVSAAGAQAAPASSRHAKAHPKARAASAKGCAPPKDDALPVAPGSKVAVFAFSGDDAEPVRRQVMHVLRAKGVKTIGSLRPVDSADQYREMAIALGLIAYVDGEVEIDGGQGSATVFVRSGATGLRIASATVSGERRQLSADIGKQLWSEVRVALGKACADAAKPHKPEREPLRINAGTPITEGREETD
jgi:hypothetical protein